MRVEWNVSPSLTDFLEHMPVVSGAAGSVESAIQEWRSDRTNFGTLARLAVCARDRCTLYIARQKAEKIIAER